MWLKRRARDVVESTWFDWYQTTRLSWSLPVILEVHLQYILQVAAREVSKCPLIDLKGSLTIMWRSYLCSASWHSWKEMSSRWTGIRSSLPFLSRTSKKSVWSTAATQAGKSHNWWNEKKYFDIKDIKETEHHI